MMGSRLPRCITTRYSVFANGLGNPGVVGLLQRRAFSAASPPPYGGSVSGGQPEKPEVSKHVGFYKEFGRPISKVFLMAFFTYQALYWLWVKLEKDEEKREKDKEVSGLFVEIERLRGAK